MVSGSKFLTRQQARDADRDAIHRLGIPGIVLMENAGRGCAEKLISLRAGCELPESDFIASKRLADAGVPDQLSSDRRGRQKSTQQSLGVVICCGSGNNGGDGFVIARHLAIQSVPVKILLFAAPSQYRGDAAVNLRIVERMRIPIVQFEKDWNDEALVKQLTTVGRRRAQWLVDALLGTGATGPLRAPLDRVVPLINQTDLKRMAIDIPTGLDCDTGQAQPTAVKADVTCTFIERKAGFRNPQAGSYLGHVWVIGIGAPKRV